MPGRRTETASLPVSDEECITVRNAQRKIRIDSLGFCKFASRALEVCHQVPPGRPPLNEPVNVVFVSDRTMARLHKRFMNVEGPTDVITFQHGEIVISAETARRQARRYGSCLQSELKLYLIHGLLHLRGFDDRTAKGAREMRRLQQTMLRRLARNRRHGV